LEFLLEDGKSIWRSHCESKFFEIIDHFSILVFTVKFGRMRVAVSEFVDLEYLSLSTLRF
jgi:hypothetical protein